MVTVTDAVLDEMVDRLVTELRPEQIILFGSRAWGTPHEDSDVDLLVIVPDGEDVGHKQAVRARHALHGLDVPVDILLKTRSQFDRRRTFRATLDAEIKERGVVLYG